jgi:hypothetical protein
MPKLYSKVVGVLLALPLLQAEASISEMYVRLKSEGVQKALYQAMSPFENQAREVVKNLDDESREIPFDLSSLNLSADLAEWARTLGEVDLAGKGKLKILFQSPEVKGQIDFGQPSFLKDGQGKLDVTLPVSVTNYRVKFEHIWFTSAGIIELDSLSENSCHHLLGNPATKEGVDYLLNSAVPEAQLRQHLKAFYSKLKNESFQGHQGKIWSRIDGLQIGYNTGKAYSDNRNRLILNLKLKLDPKKGGDGIRLVSFTHNLNKKGGGRLPVYIPQNGIIIPPTFVRTQARKIVEGIMTSEEITRCTYVDHHPLSDLVPLLSKTIAQSIGSHLTQKNVNAWMALADEWLSNVAIPELPSRLVLTPAERQLQLDIDNRKYLTGLGFDFKSDLYGVFKDFASYRAALGLGGLNTVQAGNSLELGVNADLSVNSGTMEYREDQALQAPTTRFPWTEVSGSEVSAAVSGRLLNKIINPIKDHLLKTYAPGSFHVKMDDDFFSIDSQGRIDLSPRIELDYSGVDLLKVTFTVKAKPTVFTGQDGRTWLRLNLDVPDASRIIANMRPSAEVTTVYVVANLLFGPLLTTTVSAAVLEQMRSEMQSYIQAIRRNVKDIELTDFVKESGMLPTALSFRKLSGGQSALEAAFRIKELRFIESMTGVAK